MRLCDMAMLTLLALITLIGGHTEARSPHSTTKSNGDQQISLYKATDPLMILNSDNFELLVYNKDTATLVEFYAGWCGHCQRFAPKFARFARDVQTWTSVVQVGAVNCESNVNLCRDQLVNAFPVLKLYPPKSCEPEEAIDVQPLEMTSMSIRQALIGVLTNLYVQLRPPGWPDLRPVNATDRMDLLEQLPSIGQPVVTVLVVEQDPGLIGSEAQLGQEVILDLASYQDRVCIRRLFASTNRALVEQILPAVSSSHIGLPALVRVRRGLNDLMPVEVDLLGSTKPGQSPSLKRDSFVRRVAQDFLAGIWKPPVSYKTTPPPPPDQNDDQERPEPPVPELKPVHYIDLYNTLRYSLYHEVLLHTDYNASQVDALRRYFTVLNAYFPFDNENPRRFVKRMAQWFHDRRNSTDAQNLHAIMRAGSEGYVPVQQPWKTCAGSQRHLRGYPCGLWLLFHVLTVSEYTKPRPEPSQANYHNVLYAMRDYIKNFFGCKNCAQHFMEMSANLTQELRFPNSSVLWLWQAHNQVNKRLKGDASEDPKHPKVQFPAPKDCPECSYPVASLVENDRDRHDHYQFHEKQVLKFLLNHYHKANIVKAHTAALTSKGQRLIHSRLIELIIIILTVVINRLL